MSTIGADVDAQVAEVAAIVSCPVTGDPREAINAQDVAVLVDPPTRDYTDRTQAWTLVVLRNTTDLGLATTKALGEIVAELEASDLAIESATPGARRLGLERPAVPAYLIRYTTP